MDLGALAKGKGKGKKGGKGSQAGNATNPKGGKSTTKGGSNDKNPPKSNPNADKECFYCKKKKHLKADCRKKAADERNKAKGSTALPMQLYPLKSQSL